MNRAARMARLSILSNTLLILMKLVVGILSGAVSIISEAIHSLMDLAAAIMAFFSIRIAQRPADTEHPYGHEKVENVSGVVEAILIFVAATLIIVEAVKKLLHHEPVAHLELGVAVMLVSGIVNVIVSRILYRVSRQEQSIALEADALHLKTDVYSSVGVAAGLLLIVVLTRVFKLSWAYYLDPVVAIAIAQHLTGGAGRDRAERLPASQHGPAFGAHPASRRQKAYRLSSVRAGGDEREGLPPFVRSHRTGAGKKALEHERAHPYRARREALIPGQTEAGGRSPDATSFALTLRIARRSSPRSSLSCALSAFPARGGMAAALVTGPAELIRRNPHAALSLPRMIDRRRHPSSHCFSASPLPGPGTTPPVSGRAS
jgi:hypothetical protein